ncbi:MAG TPA: phage holin family protein [Burkholderiaceae bacterium]|nr:phage holin family protein [Burkholderiaceae bacterium]
MKADLRSEHASPGLRGPGDSLLESARAILRELPALVGDRVELLSLELERAGRALVKATLLAAGAAILALTAWLAVWGVVVGALVALGWPEALAHALVVLLNAAAAALALWRARTLLRLLGLPATRRHLMLGLPDPQAEASPREELPDGHRAATAAAS